MPDLQHLWQRFLLAAALLAGLAIGVGATIFGYSNLNTVDIHWSVLHFDRIPLWAVVIVPIALILITGTIFHWLDGLHHFTEHMRHRRRVHELEAEVSRLRAHLDQVLEMPKGEALKAQDKAEEKAEEKPALPEADVAALDAEMPAASESESDVKPAKTGRTKRAKLLPETAGEASGPTENGAPEPQAAEAATATVTSDAG